MLSVENAVFAGPFMWSGRGANSQAWAEMLRMWGISPDSEKWRDILRDLDRGRVPWSSMNSVSSCLLWPGGHGHCSCTKAVWR